MLIFFSRLNSINLFQNTQHDKETKQVTYIISHMVWYTVIKKYVLKGSRHEVIHVYISVKKIIQNKIISHISINYIHTLTLGIKTTKIQLL